MINEKYIGSTFDDFLEEEGIQEQSTVMALKRVIAWQIENSVQLKKLHRRKMPGRTPFSSKMVRMDTNVW